jgi:hypothetical protein
MRGRRALERRIARPGSDSLVERSAEYSTRYYFGERGLADTIDYVRQAVGVDGQILAAKDIGLQSDRRFYEDSQAFYGMSPSEFEQFLEATPLDMVVTRDKYDYSAAVFPEQFKIIAEHFVLAPVQPADDFKIWIRRP